MNTKYFPTGMAIYKTAKETFGVDKPTAEQIKYVTQQLIPSSYLLAHHTLRGHGITFNVPNRESSNAQAHRPWQIDIVNDQAPDKVIIKSRQLGLRISSFIR